MFSIGRNTKITSIVQVLTYATVTQVNFVRKKPSGNKHSLLRGIKDLERRDAMSYGRMHRIASGRNLVLGLACAP